MRDVVLVSVGIKNVLSVRVMTVISQCSASTVDRPLIRTLRPSGNRVGIGPTVPKSAVTVRGRPQPWHRVPAPLLMRHLDPIASLVSRLPTILRHAELDAVRDLRKRELTGYCCGIW